MRDRSMRMLRTAGWLFLSNCALILGTRRVGYRLDEWVAPTLFISLFGIVMPKPPGAPWEPLHRRIVYSVAIGVSAAAVFWLTFR